MHCSTYLSAMHSICGPLLLFVLVLATSTSLSFSQTTALSDSIASAKQDSIRTHQKEIQASIHEEFDKMTRFPLSEDTETWSHSMDIEVKRGGRTHIQRFWFNPKKSNSLIWLPDTSRINEYLYYDSNTDRLASLFPENSSGTLIPSQMAIKMGLKGNSSEVSSKRLSKWEKQSSDSLLQFVLNEGASSAEIQLGEKSSWRADGMNKWLSMQPIPGILLPPSAAKQPIVFFEQTNAAGKALYSFRLIRSSALEDVFVLDLSKIQVNDPSKSLNVLAKEWADKNKEKTLED